MVRIQIGLIALLPVCSIHFFTTTPSFAKQICHDEQQRQCIQSIPRQRGPHTWNQCVQYGMVNVRVCKDEVDVNPAGLNIRIAPRSDAQGDPRLKTHQ